MLKRSNPVAVLLLFVTVAAVACSSAAKPAPAAAADGHRTIAEGYSLLYALASQQKDSDKLLIIKPESDQVDALINELSTYMAELCTELEDFSKRYPALSIETQFLPEVEVKARESITSESTKVLLGTTGKEFERYLLLKQRSALDAEHHIAKVMIELEEPGERRDFRVRTEKRIGALRVKVDRLLERDYFCA